MNSLGRFFTQQEQQYHAEREKFVRGLDAMHVADNPFLVARRQAIADLFARVELCLMARDVGGHFVECGLNKGNNLMFLAHASSVLEPYAINRRIIGFDTFAGFRSLSAEDSPDLSEQDFSASGEAALRSALELFDMNRAVGHMKKVELVKGDATQTIPKFVADCPDLTIAMLYLDFDIYEPTRVALEHLLPLVAKGGLVVFDEFNYDKFAGETKAARELLRLNQVELKRFYYAPFICYFRV
jgi:hypothetical protein